MIGETVGSYRVVSQIGVGGMGAVYLAEHPLIGKKVAIKVLRSEYSTHPEALHRFFNEARATAQLRHPSLIEIFDYGVHPSGGAYIVMEYLEGETLEARIRKGYALLLPQIVDIAFQIASGLGVAHRAGIVHRDLKPENVLIDRYGRWRLADFGIANATGEEIAGASGTPAFAPPEQLLGEEQDAAADCFSLAAIVAYSLTGTPPFGERDSASILARELRGDVDLSSYPTEIAEWLKRGLAASVEERFADAVTMQAAWREAVSAVLVQDRPVPWWRRWFAGDSTDGGAAWTGDAFPFAIGEATDGHTERRSSDG
jgi:eukaryotic-like serine/threonine-protein kinase